MQKQTTYQRLKPEDRMTIASMRRQGSSMRATAHILDRSASTISRELQRNAGLHRNAMEQAIDRK
ncbi:MAG: helix-turn-helix domain-containing protein [Rhodocyclaceae bacterium]|nr:helix-turn-helix domain-containing protein [Rhodocyclaceae bacterium]